LHPANPNRHRPCPRLLENCMEPIQYLRTIRRRWVIIAAFIFLGLVLGGLTGVGHGKKQKQRSYYKATCVLYYDSSAITEKGAAFTALSQMGLLTTTGDVPAEIAQKHNTDVNSLIEQVQSVTDPNQSTIRITTVGTSAAATTALANEWCTDLAKFVNDANTKAYTDNLNASAAAINDLTTKIDAATATNPPVNSVAGQNLAALINQYRVEQEQLQAIGPSPGPILTVLQHPTASPISPEAYAGVIKSGQEQTNNVTLTANAKNPEAALDSGLNNKSKIPEGPIPRALIGGFIGLLFGIILAFVIERLDTRIQTKDDAELAFDLPVLCEVPPLNRVQRNDTEVISFTHPMSRTAEAYRALRSSIVFLRQTGAAGSGHGEGTTSQVVMVTSAGPSEGKTTSVANLAAMFAEANFSVLVINCDFRRPRLHRYLGGSDEARKVVQSDVTGVRMVNNVLSSTNPNPAEVTSAQRRVIDAARGIFDIILLDTAPLLSTNDASELISVSDLVVLVAKAGRTTRPNAQRATEVLQRLEATVAGVALLGARYVPSAQYYYYAVEEGRDPNRPDAEAHPLDLLVRADGMRSAQSNGTSAGRDNGAKVPADHRESESLDTGDLERDLSEGLQPPGVSESTDSDPESEADGTVAASPKDE
jgi:Mrp family chromosome partitioning ATPase